MPLEDPRHLVLDERFGHGLVWLTGDWLVFTLVFAGLLGLATGIFLAVAAVAMTMEVEPFLPPVPRRPRLALAEVASRHV